MRKQTSFQIVLTALFLSAVSILTVNAQTNITYTNPWHYVNSPHGYVRIGPANTSGAHIYTNMPRFYFDKPIHNISGEFSAYNQKDLQLQTQGITRITAKRSNGNVGIGTASPLENGNISSYHANLNLETHGTTRMTILNSNGNVGIGTTTPENALDVAGIIRAEKCIVELGWADYVLYDDYDLPTLEEEEKHIEENGHLLGFESEEDMAVQLGDVSKRQQVKIEEIMLHLIDIKKEVVRLNGKIAELEEENGQLKEEVSKK